MNRKPTPNIMDELLPVKSETTELRSGLKWDYSQLGAAAGAVIEHTIEIKRNERRANEAAVEAGRHLIAVKESLSHGQWGDWLETEFAMSDSTAQTMMNIARRFGANSQPVGNLSYSVLGLLASPSVPEAAVNEVVQRSQAGDNVTKAQARAVIDQHRPQKVPLRHNYGLPPLNLPPPPVMDGGPLPGWVNGEPDTAGNAPLTATDVEALASAPETRMVAMSRLINIYSQTIVSFDEYGSLTGAYTETLAAQRGLETLIRRLSREIAMLNDEVVE